MKKPVLFLDRDGTINIDLITEYISRAEQAALIPGAGLALARARDYGFLLSVITNQAGVAKGLTPPDAVPAVHRHIESLVAAEAGLPKNGFRFDDIRVCPHHPDEKCRCRKPESANLAASIQKLRADPARSFFVGDKISDIVCGTREGLRSILVLTGHGTATRGGIESLPRESRPVAVVASLTEAVELARELAFRR